MKLLLSLSKVKMKKKTYDIHEIKEQAYIKVNGASNSLK